MTIERIIQSLKLHNVPYYIENGEIWADSMEGNAELFSECVNLTNYSMKELYIWLGYEF